MDIPLKPIIARMGGKSQLVDRLIEMIPPHDTYVELFTGGASLFLKKPLSKFNVINDTDTDIMNIYKDIRDVENIDDFIIDEEDVTAETYKGLKDMTEFNNKHQRLFRNILLSKLSFSGNRKSFGGAKTRVPKFDQIKRYYDNYRYKFQHADILNEDFKKVIDKYDNKKTFFFFDPPYSELKKSWGYKDNTITPEEIFKILCKLKGKFLMTYDYSIDNVKLFGSKFNIYEVDTNYWTKKADERKDLVKEIIITNYD